MQPKLFRSLFDFFDLHLLKEPGAKALPPVQLFRLGDDTWEQTSTWPPPNQSTKIFALAGPESNDDEQEGGGNILVQVGSEKNKVKGSEISYLYDPSDPTPQIGGSTFCPSNCGRKDQTGVENRDDVLVFTTKPLDKPMTVAGEIKIRLAVESNVEGTDYVGRACHVTPDGKSQNIADGIVRKFDLEPGRKTKIEITLSPVINRLAANDRLRIHICSAAYPKYGRHLNTRESFHLEVEGNALLSEQILFLGGDDGCEVFVPVIP